MQIIHNAIAGKLTQSVSSRTQPVFNPATGEAIATLPLSTLDEVNAAVAAAKKAQPAWGNTTPMKLGGLWAAKVFCLPVGMARAMAWAKARMPVRASSLSPCRFSTSLPASSAA